MADKLAVDAPIPDLVIYLQAPVDVLFERIARRGSGFDKMIDMDVAYVRSRSLLMDMLILVMTVRAVATGRGAY